MARAERPTRPQGAGPAQPHHGLGGQRRHRKPDCGGSDPGGQREAKRLHRGPAGWLFDRAPCRFMSRRVMVAAGWVEGTVGCAMLRLWVAGCPWALLQRGPTGAPSALWRPTPPGPRGRGALRGSGGGGSGDVVGGGGAQELRPYIRISAPSSAGRGRPAASRPGLPGAP